MNYNRTIGEKLVCPVCDKTFTASEDTNYIAQGGYTCSWKCFLDCVKSVASKKQRVKSSNCK